MKILAIDTATEACSAALLAEDRLVARYAEPKRGHAEIILPMVDEVLKEAGMALKDIDAIAVGRGPGAFTGVRIAISVAQGLAYGVDRPVVPISDLAALAQRAADEYHSDAVLACIDARMNEVYWAGFKRQADGLVAACTDEHIGSADSVSAPWSGNWVGAGTGWGAYPTLARRLLNPHHENQNAPVRVVPTLLPRAEEIARLAVRELRAGRAMEPHQVQPVYLRNQVAWTAGAADPRLSPKSHT